MYILHLRSGTPTWESRVAAGACTCVCVCVCVRARLPACLCPLPGLSSESRVSADGINFT